jgi:hypothetical protein
MLRAATVFLPVKVAELMLWERRSFKMVPFEAAGSIGAIAALLADNALSSCSTLYAHIFLSHRLKNPLAYKQ